MMDSGDLWLLLSAAAKFGATAIWADDLGIRRSRINKRTPLESTGQRALMWITRCLSH
jgi:hypothetical protein